MEPGEKFVGDTPGEGRLYEIAREVMALLSERKMAPQQACSVLACCIDWCVQQYEGPEKERFKTETVALVHNLVFYKEETEAAS